MEDLWTEETKYQYWIKVESELTRAQGWDEWWRVAEIRINKEDVAAIKEIEASTRHDVAAFVDWLENRVDYPLIHYGATSSDIVDTAMALQICKGLGILRQKAGPLGVPLHWLVEATQEMRYGTLSGPVGTYSSITPEVEEKTLGWLGLKPEPAPTQVVARDRYAYLMFCLAMTASVIERGIVKGKRNGLTSAGSMIRTWTTVAMEDVALWHERDISHSAVERIIIPESFKGLASLIDQYGA